MIVSLLVLNLDIFFRGALLLLSLLMMRFQEFVTSLEMAMGKTEMECPASV